MLPYFWFFFLLIFLGMASVYFRRTEKGYRFHIAMIISGCLVISAIGGFLLYHTGFSEKLETLFQEKIPVYRTLTSGRHRMWQSPENGLLAGEITELVSDGLIGIRDLQGHRWRIDISNALWRGRLRPEIGLKIKLIGKATAEKSFTASEIRPLIGRGYRRRFKTRGSLHSR
jgi:TM2 domain-containing membrane protein YozV